MNIQKLLFAAVLPVRLQSTAYAPVLQEDEYEEDEEGVKGQASG